MENLNLFDTFSEFKELKNIDRVAKLNVRRIEIEAMLQSEGEKPVTSDKLLELAGIYHSMQKNNELRTLVGNALKANLPVPVLLQLAQQLAQMRRLDMADAVLTKYVSMMPNDVRVWIELGAIRLARNRVSQSLAALEKAVEQGGDNVRALLTQDARFRPLYNNQRFRALAPPRRAPNKAIPLDNLF